MNSLFHKMLAFAMAGIVLFTTMSFTVDLHYCGDSLVDFSVLHSAETCGMDKQQSENDCKNEVTAKDCCSDIQIVIKGQDDIQKTSFHQLTLEQQIFVGSFTYAYINLFDGLDANIVPFRDYVPPLIIRDIQKIHETYII